MNQELIFVVTLLYSAAGFAAYYFLSGIHKPAAGEPADSGPDRKRSIRTVLCRRLAGFLFLGLVPACMVLLAYREHPGTYGAGIGFLQAPPWWVYLLPGVILFFTYLTAPSRENLAIYPQMRLREWTPGILLVSASSWLLFLAGYEFFFRGFLLTASLSVLEPRPAVALNCALYAFAHLYKGPLETFGAIPMGILLCYLTILTGNIWVAVLIHATMALGNEWWSIAFHPGMHFSWQPDVRTHKSGS